MRLRSYWGFCAPVPWSNDNRGIVFIEDLGGPISVTNDAENVLTTIQSTWPKQRVVCRGTDGVWFEIYWDSKIESTARFRPWYGEVWDGLTRPEIKVDLN